MAETAKSLSAAMPLGRNCQLGMALTAFGDHEASLLRWADIPLERLIGFLESGRALFTGRTAYRFVGFAFGTLSHADMRARLVDAPEGPPINTIVFDEASEAYIHGVQLTRAEAARLAQDDICAANAAKIGHLHRKWADEWASLAPVAIRLEWAPVADPDAHAGLAAALRRINPAVALKIVGPEGGAEGWRDGVEFVAMRSALPPLSDVMNVSHTQAEWRALFTRWGLRPRGAPRAYVFGV